MPRQEFLFPSFSGGLADGLAGDTAPEGALRVCDNADFSKAPIGGVTARPPVMMRGVPDVTGQMRWLVRFQNYRDSNWPYALIGAGKAYPINRMIDEFGDAEDLSVSLDSWYAVPDEDKIYFVGGVDPAVMATDFTTRKMGNKVENTWVVTLNTGGSVDVGLHHYRLIVTDKNGRKLFAGEPLEVTVADTTNDKVSFANIPICDGEHKYLYRTKTGASKTDVDNPIVYYLVGILDGQATTYDDSDADATIAVNDILDETQFGFPPANLMFMTIHNGLAWGWTQDRPSVLRYTTQFDYENWPEINSIPIGDPDEIVAAVSVGDMLMIFKKNKCYAFYGSHFNNFDYRELSTTYGTVYTKTIRVLDSNRVVFLDSQKRLILFSGGQFTEISKAVRLPASHRYWASLYRDYYILWMYGSGLASRDIIIGPIPDIQTFPEEGPYFRMDSPEEEEGGDIPFPPILDDPPPDDPPISDPPPDGPPIGDQLINDSIWGERHEDAFYDPPDIDAGPVWIIGDTINFQRPVVAYCYHIPTGAWTKWTDIKASLPEIPDRPGENQVFWDGHQLGVIGVRDYVNSIGEPEFVVRTTDSDCGFPNQEKSFKEVEIYFEHIGRFAWTGSIGTMQVIVDDGSDNASVFEQEIIYNSVAPIKRQKFRIKNGANGTRASVRFVGLNNMFRFSLLQVRLFWELRGTPRR